MNGNESGSASPAHGSAARSAEARLQGAKTASAAPPSAPSILEELSGALESARAQVADSIELVSLEARRAGLTLVAMIALGLIAAVSSIVAWVGLLAALAMWAVSLGLRPIPVAIVLALVSLLVAAGLAYACISMSRALLLPATRRQLAGKSTAAPS